MVCNPFTSKYELVQIQYIEVINHRRSGSLLFTKQRWMV